MGLTLAGRLLTDAWDPVAIVYALLSLTVIRMLPVGIALLGLQFRPATVLFMGWFGPRGLASIVFLIIGIDGLQDSGMVREHFAAAAAWTVLLSVVLHGLSAGPLAARYGRRVAALAPDRPSSRTLRSQRRRARTGRGTACRPGRRGERDTGRTGRAAGPAAHGRG